MIRAFSFPVSPERGRLRGWLEGSLAGLCELHWLRERQEYRVRQALRLAQPGMGGAEADDQEDADEDEDAAAARRAAAALEEQLVRGLLSVRPSPPPRCLSVSVCLGWMLTPRSRLVGVRRGTESREGGARTTGRAGDPGVRAAGGSWPSLAAPQPSGSAAAIGPRSPQCPAPTENSSWTPKDVSGPGPRTLDALSPCSWGAPGWRESPHLMEQDAEAPGGGK